MPHVSRLNVKKLTFSAVLIISWTLGLTTSSAQAVPPLPKGEMTLRELADARGLLIGGAVAAGVLDPDEPDLANGVAREYNVIVTENAMKWVPLNNASGQFNFTLAEFMMNFATKNKQKMRGHTLVWHEQLPRYMGAITDRAEMMAELKDHVQTVVKQFKGRIPIWDVVNEAVSDLPGFPMRETVFTKVIGPEFIEMAFRWAHEADPDAKLFYNDYNTDGINGKSDAVYELVKGLLAKGVPIHGVGFQAHVDINFSVEGSRMRENLERFKKLGLDVQLTEVDVIFRGDAPKAEKLERQAKVYADLMTACLAVKCSAFVMWGFTDLYSWRSTAYPLLFDDDYKPKPAYFALRDVLIKTPR